MTILLSLSLSSLVVSAAPPPKTAEGDILRFVATSSEQNKPLKYFYWTIGEGAYTFKAGDMLEYDVYIDTMTPGLGGFEIYNADDGNLRDWPTFKDQNNVAGHPSANLSTHAFKKWYHRKMPIPDGAAGTTSKNWCIPIEISGSINKTYMAFYDNIVITNGGNVVFTAYGDGKPEVSQSRMGTSKDFAITVSSVPVSLVGTEPTPTPAPVVPTKIVLKVGSTALTVSKYGIPEAKTIESAPVLKDGRTYLPIRAVVEALGGTLSWDASTQKIGIAQGKIAIDLWVNKPTAKVNGTDKPIDSSNTKVAPYISSEGRTMVPVRFVSENLGAKVNFEQSTQTITIDGSAPVLPTPVPTPTPISTAASKLRFVVVGDSRAASDDGFYNKTDDGTNPAGISSVLKGVKQLNPQPEFTVMLGDLINGGNKGSNYETQKTQLSNFKSHILEQYPIEFFFPVVGNHDTKTGDPGEKAFAETFPEFKADKFCTAYDAGRQFSKRSIYYFDKENIRFFVLNTHLFGEDHRITNAQYDFVKANIDQTKKNTVFLLHEPFWGTWKANFAQDMYPEERNKFYELVNTAPKPMVFAAHEHIYSRRHVDASFGENGYVFKQNIFHVTTGGFGGPLNSEFNGDPRNVDVPPIGKFHFVVVDIKTDDSIEVKAIDTNGNVLDHFNQVKW